MHHYVYEVKDLETGEFYIGSRSTNLLPEEDFKYKGSQYQWKLSKDRKENLHKTILKSDFSNRTEAIIYEASVIKENFNNPLNKNGTIPDGKYHTKDKVIVKDKTGYIFCVDKNDERYVSGELSSVNKGRKLTNEHKAKISWYGKKHKEETKKKISQSQSGKPRIHKTRAKTILQLDINGNFIREWNSLSDAANFYKTSIGSLSSGVNKENKIRVGYKWKWKE